MDPHKKLQQDFKKTHEVQETQEIQKSEGSQALPFSKFTKASAAPHNFQDYPKTQLQQDSNEIKGLSGHQSVGKPVVRMARAQSLREQCNNVMRLKGPQKEPLSFKQPSKYSSTFFRQVSQSGTWEPVRPHADAQLGGLSSRLFHAAAEGPSLKTPSSRKATEPHRPFVNYIAANIEALSRMKTKRGSQEMSTKQILKHKSFGVVPKYIRVSKQERDGLQHPGF